MADLGVPGWDRPPVLAGRYELGPLLGAGGMARVYRGVDRLLERPVAVKVFAGGSPPVDHASDGAGEGARRLRREARVIASLDHPNIVGVHDIGWSDGALWIVMEHVEGSTLAALLRERGPLPPDEVADLGEQVCAALAAAHRAGVVHRDVTPGNVLVRRDGRVKLADFGIALVAGRTAVTAAGLVVGTPAYMSPEQVRGDPVDARSDLYSAGCCLFEVLTGRPPFEGHGPVDTAFQRLRQHPPRASAIRTGIPVQLEQVILTAMALDPADRYPDAHSMCRALVACHAPVHLPGTSGRPAVREPLRAAPSREERDRIGPDLSGPDLIGPDLSEPDEGATRRRIGAALIAVSTAVLLVVAVLLLHQHLTG